MLYDGYFLFTEELTRIMRKRPVILYLEYKTKYKPSHHILKVTKYKYGYPKDELIYICFSETLIRLSDNEDHMTSPEISGNGFLSCFFSTYFPPKSNFVKFTIGTDSFNKLLEDEDTEDTLKLKLTLFESG